ncbi:6-bladed beta-propeller [Prolixibacteraceae bacterium JC049]|nr:6-bladed beta-propeller [Prolixibacteraceae bacterium JC049]
MKRLTLITAIALSFSIVSCEKKADTSTEIIRVDVNANYPQKEIILQDFMDVEYIPLETSKEFITYGFVEAIGKNMILVRNRARDGNLFIFDRTGKGVRKINRMGRGDEEYSGIFGVILDEASREIFVEDYPARKILVYDLKGNFKRKFEFADTCYYRFLENYDNDNLIGYKSYSPAGETKASCHVLISKKDGSITREIKLPVGELQTHIWIKDDIIVEPEYCNIIPSQSAWVLSRTSSDTIYSYQANGSKFPFIIASPSIQTMNPQIFLYPSVVTDRYCFMKTVKKQFDLQKRKGFPTNSLAYDNQEKTVFQYKVINGNYTTKKSVNMKWGYANNEIATCSSLSALSLIEANKEGQLKGRLKEIASRLNEESNSVLMLVKHKQNSQN